nr:unknown [Zea mays]
MESASTTVPSIVVYVTVPNREAGKKLSQSIISEKLAACVNIVPGIESVYWWEGKVQSDAEELLIIKTRESLLDALTAHVKANHEYDVPEVIALPITGGNTKYLEWIKNSTRDK